MRRQKYGQSTLATVIAFTLVGLTLLACAKPTVRLKSPVSAELEIAEGCHILDGEAPNSTFVLLFAETGALRLCNQERANERFLPASTFKVPHALIALETRVASGPHEAIPWDRVDRTVPAWNADTTLEKGLQDSTVWYYQAIARRIGYVRMREEVERLGFGNADIGPKRDLTSFWLDGALRISAVEQVAFLDALRRRSLPASPDNQFAVAEMMRQHAGSSLHAKSGAVLSIDPNTGDISSDQGISARLDGLDRVGWYVGWVTRSQAEGGDVVFAFNLDLSVPNAMSQRFALTHRLLAENDVMQLSR